MTFAEDMADATKDIVDTLGDSVIYSPQNGGSTTTVFAVFDRSAFFEDTEVGSVLMYDSFLLLAEEDCVNWKEGDHISVNGTDYEMTHAPEFDSHGQAQVGLKLRC